MKSLLLPLTFLLAFVVAGSRSLAEETRASNAYDVFLKPQTLVQLPDGRHFNLFCTGKGRPTAILEASASRWNISWRRIQPNFAKLTRVCSVDRPGFGFSDPGPLPRDMAAEEADLRAALAAAGIKPPYVMVGHSYGGALVRLYAYRHPDEVAGMLLIDPGFEHQARRLDVPDDEVARSKARTIKCIEIARAGNIVLGKAPPGEDEPCEQRPGDDFSRAMKASLQARAGRPQYYEANAAEEATYGTLSSEEIDAARHPLGNIPLVVLSQDEEHFVEDEQDGKKRYAAWLAWHEDIAKDSTRSIHETVSGAGHFIFNDRKDVVLAKFREIVEAIRQQSSLSAGIR